MDVGTFDVRTFDIGHWTLDAGRRTSDVGDRRALNVDDLGRWRTLDFGLWFSEFHCGRWTLDVGRWNLNVV